MSTRSKQIQAGVYQRTLELDRSAADPESRSVPAALSSEVEVERWFGREVLAHEPNAIRLERAANGLPLLLGHDGSRHVIGRVEDVHIADRKLRGKLVFHDLTGEARETWDLVRDGWMRDISIGYKVHKWEETENSDLVRVTSWTPVEASVVSVPADHTVGINRSIPNEETAMSTNDGTPVSGNDGQGTVVDLARVSERALKQGKQEGLQAGAKVERARLAGIREVFDNPVVPRGAEFDALRAEAEEAGWSVDATRSAVFDLLGQRAEPAFDHASVADRKPPVREIRDHASGRTQLSITRDERQTLAESIEQALLIRAGILTDKATVQEARERGMAGMDLVSMGREMLSRSGHANAYRIDKHAVAKLMLARELPAHSHSDFPYILANVATKIARKGYEEAPTTYQDWANVATLPDFKTAYIPGLGSFSDLDEIPLAGGPYKHGTIGDISESATLKPYGKLFGLSRVAIVNDDLNQFARAGIAMGAAAARKVNSLAYTLLTATGSGGYGQTMTEDSTSCFHANHANYVASGSGAAPSVDTLNAAEAAMLKQKAPVRSGETASAYLNVRPGHLIVPPDLLGTAEVLMSAMFDPNGTTSARSLRDAPNRWKGRLTVTADPLANLNTGKGWWLAAPKGNTAIDTITVFFLEGQQGPYTEEAETIDFDGKVYKVRIDAVARALDYRGLYLNYGS